MSSKILPGVAQVRSTARDDKGQSEVQIGLKIAPVPLNLKGKDIALVGRGRYLVNPDTYLQGGSTNFGPFIPRNLTPDLTGKPEGGASFEEFKHTMRSGIDPDQAHQQFGSFLQVMPWPNLNGGGTTFMPHSVWEAWTGKHSRRSASVQAPSLKLSSNAAGMWLQIGRRQHHEQGNRRTGTGDRGLRRTGLCRKRGVRHQHRRAGILWPACHR